MTIYRRGTYKDYYPAFNPIIAKFLRVDFAVSGIAANPGGNVRLQITDTEDMDYASQVSVGDMVYFETENEVYDRGWYEVLEVTDNRPTSVVLKINLSYIGFDQGIANCNAIKPNYHIKMRVDVGVGTRRKSTDILFTDDNYGRFFCDISPAVRKGLSKDNDFDYTVDYEEDFNLSEYVQYKVIEVWDGSDEGSPGPSYSATYELYAINAGLNYKESFIFDPEESTTHKFLSDFVRCEIYSGYPFDLSIVPKLDGCSEWRVVMKQYNINFTMVKQTILGLTTTTYLDYVNRINLDINPESNTKFFGIQVEGNDGGWTQISEEKIVKVSDTCLENNIYLCWLNRYGGFSYWMFNRNYSRVIDSGQTEFKSVSKLQGDIQNILEDSNAELSIDNYIDGYFNKPMEIYRLGTQNVGKNFISGLIGLLTSTRVYMLTNQAEWYENKDLSPIVEPEWKIVRISPDTFEIGEKANNAYNIEFDLVVGDINTQRL